MYFWNINKLNKKLEKGLSEKENLQYFLVMTLIWATALFTPFSMWFYEILSWAAVVILTVLLIVVFYNVNGWNSGKDFLSRYFAIGFVAFIRSIPLVLIPLIIIYWIILGFIFGENVPTTVTKHDIIFTILYSLGYLYLNIKYLKQLLNK